jgi:two-component system, NarL family, sensor kinase
MYLFIFTFISQAGWYLTGASVLFIFLFALFLVFFIKDKQKQVIKEQKTRNDYEQAILRTQLEIQEQTLKNISEEIHDNIGQALSLAKLNLNTILPVADENLYQKILNSKELISKAIGDLRDLSRSLDTDYVKEMGLQRAIEYALEMMHKTETIKTRLTVDGSIIRLEKQKELVIFRIVQETFNNIIKHADATELEVNIQYSPTSIEIQITDNGKGVDLSPLSEGNNASFGLGIRNMHNRAKLIGADFHMDSTLGRGTRVKIILPIENNNHENRQ